MLISTGKDTVHIWRTARFTDERLSALGPVRFEPCHETGGAVAIHVNSAESYQRIEGFGGSFTESSAWTLAQIGPANRDRVLRAYFGEGGLGYTLGRTHINSCDFSLGHYACAEVPDDWELRHFTIERDKQYLVPLIKDAIEISPLPLRIMASPWSPPGWMKTNGTMHGGGGLRPECAPVWALHYARFIQAYKRQGIPIWSVSVQNEPEAVQVWDSCIWTAEEERNFVRDYLGPCLAREGLADVKILIWDHNKDRLVDRAATVLDDAAAAAYVWGVGFHWYGGDHFDQLAEVHRRFPDKRLLFTEGCQEGGVHFGSWDVGERYGRELIGDLNHYAVGFIDWNLVLDERGGPNHVGNYCDAPIIADTQNDTLHFQSSFYYLGHFSKFIKPGATRVGCECDGALLTSAFLNADGTTAVIVMNCGESRVPVELRDRDRVVHVESLAHSIMTLVYE